MAELTRNINPTNEHKHKENCGDETATEDDDQEPDKASDVPVNMSPGAVKLRGWINQLLRITMSDGRVLVGMFFCTDRDANIILGACSEYLPEEADEGGETSARDVEEPRILGLVMVPGKHIVSIAVDVNENEPCGRTAQQPPAQDEVM